MSFEVTDDGAGIAPSERERVFDAFYRVLGTDADGSGLGLSIVKTMVERAGGSVSLHDAGRDSGSRGLHVVVRFPAGAVAERATQDMLTSKVGEVRFSWRR